MPIRQRSKQQWDAETRRVVGQLGEEVGDGGRMMSIDILLPENFGRARRCQGL